MARRTDETTTEREDVMNQLSPNTVKNLVVAVTLSLAALVSWAFTDYRAPIIEVAAAQSQQG